MQKIRVLIADDHTVVREGLCIMLANQPDLVIVAQAADSDEVIEQARLHRPDVILMDIRMPPRDGIRATRMVKETMPDIKVIILTVHDEDDYIASAFQAGASGYLLKDISRQDLMAAIVSVHKGNPALSPTIAQGLLCRVTAPPKQSSQPLTEREREVLRRVARGEPTLRIAMNLAVSEATVRRDLQLVRRKLGTSHQAESVAKAFHQGLI